VRVKIVLALVGLMLVGIAPPAGAERFHATDAADDVAAVPYDCVGPCTVAPAPDQPRTDLLAMSATYRPRVLRLSATMAALDLAARPPAQYVFRILTSARIKFAVGVYVLRGRSRVFLDKRNHGARCPGLEVTADDATATVVATVPALCLGSPHWVAVDALAFSAGSSGAQHLVDDALQSEPTSGNIYVVGDRITAG
jgi:hypothetical protein